MAVYEHQNILRYFKNGKFSQSRSPKLTPSLLEALPKEEHTGTSEMMNSFMNSEVQEINAVMIASRSDPRRMLFKTFAASEHEVRRSNSRQFLL